MNYLFIDGGYLIEEYESQTKAFFGEAGELNLDTVRKEAGAQKAFYYYCVDDVPRRDETPKELTARIAAQDVELARIRRLPGFHVREGVIRGEGRRKRRQKKVDVQLAVDMLMHRVHGVMERAVLIAGDLDLLPAVESLVQLGADVAVWHGQSVAEELLAGADHVLKLTLPKL